MSNNQSGTASKIDHYRVHRGEPGCHVVTPLKDGAPVIENLPVALASPSASSVPSLIDEQAEGAVTSLDNEKANFRFALVNLLNQEEAKKDRPKGDVINNLLKLYNSGILLPNVYEKLGPVSRATLYRLQEAFDKGGVEGLAPQKGQKGVSKITDHEKNYLLTILMRPNRIKKAYAITLTKEILKLRGIESPSGERTLRRFIDQFEKEHSDIWVLSREGEKAFDDKILPYAERDWQLLEVGEGLVADGHRLNVQVINPYTGKPCRPVLVMFWDWRSSYCLGWDIMIEENIQCIASALRNSILALGKIPKFVYLDNGKAFRSDFFTEDINFEDTELPGMFNRLNIRVHFAQPYNAQSKPIERIFGILNEQLERLMDSYIGSSIEDKPAWTKRNEKLARSAHNFRVPTIQEASELICAWRDRYAERPSRGRDGLRPIDIFNEGKGPGVNPLELIYLMMEREIKTVHRNGITWLGWHWFNEALIGLRDKVVIRYSLSDLSQIFVFYKNEFLCTARPVEKVHPMASESENPKDMEAVKEVIRLKKRAKNTTRKLLDLLGTKMAAQIDWDRTRSGEIAETIQAIEEKQRPEMVPISPWLKDEEAGWAPMPPEESKERPKYKPPKDWSDFKGEFWKKYDYLMAQDPKTLTQEDLEFIDLYKVMPEYRAVYEVKPGPILSGG